MIKVIPNQVVCSNCMSILEYESSDVIETTIKCSIFENDDFTRVTNDYEEKSLKYIECPNCKTKTILDKNYVIPLFR